MFILFFKANSSEKITLQKTHEVGFEGFLSLSFLSFYSIVYSYFFSKTDEFNESFLLSKNFLSENY